MGLKEVFLKPNKTFEEGGGLTSKIIPYQLNKTGVAAGFIAGGAASLGSEMLANRNRLKMGPVTYGGGPARMTKSFDSGAIQAIQEATSDPAIQQDMLRKILHSTDNGLISNIEEYGVDSEFLSAFYGM